MTNSSQETLVSIIASSEDAIISKALDGTITTWNKGAETLFGFTAEEAIGMNASILIAADRRHEWPAMVEKMKRGERVPHYETERITKKGRVVSISLTISPIKDESGAIIGGSHIARDISNRKSSDAALQSSEKMYRNLFENMLHGFAYCKVIFDEGKAIDYVCTAANTAYETLTGLTGVRGRRITELIPGILESYPEIFDRIGRVALSGMPERFETYILDRWLSISLYCPEKGYFVGLVDNITESKRAVEQLTKSEERLKEAQAIALIGNWEINLLSNTQSWSDEVYRLYGITKEEVTPSARSFLSFMHPDDLEFATKYVEKAIAYASNASFHYRYIRKDGAVRYGYTEWKFEFDKVGMPIRLFGIIQDVSRQKEFEKSLTAMGEELSSLIENANAPIFGVDFVGCINEWNRFAEELSGYSKAEVIGKKWISLLDQNIHGTAKDVLYRVFLGESTGNYELPILSKSGKNLVILTSISPRLDINKKITGAICVGQDVTEVFYYRQNLEKIVEERTSELHAALTKEKELVEMKSRFVAIASHEFRTPLSTISFAAESIRNYFHQLTAVEVQRKLIKIEDQASHMTNLLDDILTLGKTDAGKIKVKRVGLDLKVFIDSLIEEVRSTVKDKREILFTFSCASRKVNADDKLLRNIISNLLTNAIKFSAADTTVSIAVSDFKGDVLIVVTDHGIGIEESELGSIFESFQRGSNASAIQGTGLGLSILKKAVELMDGSIAVTSALNKGSTFTVQIPIR